MMIRSVFPIIMVVALVVMFSIRLSAEQSGSAQDSLNQPVPPFKLPLLHSPTNRVATSDLIGQVWVVNVWASWCSGCRTEHALITRLSRDYALTLIGMNYRDQRRDAKRWLRMNGNPYDLTAVSNPGPRDFDWGKYGVPATYVIDQQGVIRYQHIGVLSIDALEQELLPAVRHLDSPTLSLARRTRF